MRTFIALALILSPGLAWGGNPTWSFHIGNGANTESTAVILTEPRNRLQLEVRTDADLPQAKLRYRCEMLVRGDTVYHVNKLNNVTGSTTTGLGGSVRRTSATAVTICALASMPVLMAPTARSASTASI